jgi:hypothetical protein
VEWWTVLGADPPYQVEAGFEAAATRHYGLLATTRRYSAPIATVPSVSLVDLVDERIELPHQLESSERNSNHDCRPITDEGVAFGSDTATGMMPAAHRVAGVLAFQ